MKPLRLHPEAEVELEQALRFYEECAPGLGADLLDEVRRTFEDIRRLPLAGSPEEYGLRRSLLRRFPFAVVYEVRSDDVVAVAGS